MTREQLERLAVKECKNVESLGEALPKEQARVRGLIAIYRDLPGGAGMPAAMLMENDLRTADQAIMRGDVVAMIRIYESLKEWQS